MNILRVLAHGMFCVLLAVSTLHGAERPAATLTSMGVLDDLRRLKPGDMVTIHDEGRSWEDCQMVSAEGKIRYPHGGLRKVEGLTCREVAHDYRAVLEKGLGRTVQVHVALTHYLSSEPKKGPGIPPSILLFGYVAKQGRYELPKGRDLTVLGALELTGGSVSKKVVPRIEIVRQTKQGEKRILVNSRALLRDRRSEYDLFLRADDVVTVK